MLRAGARVSRSGEAGESSPALKQVRCSDPRPFRDLPPNDDLRKLRRKAHQQLGRRYIVASTSSTPPSCVQFCRSLFDTPRLFRQNREFRSEGFPSGQREQTVNLPAMPSKVRILPPPPVSSEGYGRRAGGNAGGPGLVPAAAARWLSAGFEDSERGCSSMVEQKPSKLTTRVRFPSPAPHQGRARATKSPS